MTPHSADLYEVLEVPPRADRTTLARAWRMKRDRVTTLSGAAGSAAAEALCAKLDEAFAILSNPRREARYRQYRAGLAPEGPAPMAFDSAGNVSGPTTSARHDVLAALLDPPDSETPQRVDPDRDPDLATPSTEWELDAAPGARTRALAAGSALRPTLPKASAARGAAQRKASADARSATAVARKSAKDDRLLRALPAPPWS
jgi:curved DNA-binding protein CbpA